MSRNGKKQVQEIEIGVVRKKLEARQNPAAARMGLVHFSPD